ncbi:ovochymase-like [Oppia nitens]|uniref:ovochymase-like n=1 Tax=Oppia nitens TaxID=1686743 RepID=UPI0023DAF9E5|nr:ovochymase-like [Oppia nitens]
MLQNFKTISQPHILLSSVLVSFSVCIHSQIKHYPNVTLDTCGIGRQSLLTTKNCFKWSSNVTTSVQNGRLAQPGEWPWIVYIYSTYYFLEFIPLEWVYCTGVILNTNWIITAAHCIHSGHTLTVRTVQDSNDKSHIYGVNQWFRHPLYTDKLKDYFDIALLKLDSNIPITHTAGYYTVNGICLPEKNIVNIDDELGLVAGFGYIDQGVSNPGPLRTGWLKLMKIFTNSTDAWGAWIIAFRYPTNGGTATCKGDSGGPLIQNVLSSDSSDGQNRAVLIGVSSSLAVNKPVGYCLNPDPTTQMVFMRVSKFIEWIVETVLSNTN